MDSEASFQIQTIPNSEVGQEITQEPVHTVQTMQNVHQMKCEQAKILQAFNTPKYSILEFGAQTMLFYESVVAKVEEWTSAETIVDCLSGVFSYVSNWMFSSSAKPKPKVSGGESEKDIDKIQAQLEFVMKQMQAVQDDNIQKSREIEELRSNLQRQATSPRAKPAPPPFPKELESYSRQAEQAPEKYVQTISSPVSAPHRISPPVSPVHQPAPVSPKKKPPPHPTILPNRRISSPPRSPKKAHAQPPPLPSAAPPMQKPASLLEEIRDQSNRAKLRKVPKEADGTPIQKRPALVEHTPSLNDEVREKLRERIRMMEDSEPEDDVNWRESDIF